MKAIKNSRKEAIVRITIPRALILKIKKTIAEYKNIQK